MKEENHMEVLCIYDSTRIYGGNILWPFIGSCISPTIFHELLDFLSDNKK